MDRYPANRWAPVLALTTLFTLSALTATGLATAPAVVSAAPTNSPEGGWVEVQLIVDFIDGHRALIFLPEQQEANPYIEVVKGFGNGTAKVVDEWWDKDSVHGLELLVPKLISDWGTAKVRSLNLEPLRSAAEANHLDQVSVFVVFNRTSGAFNYLADVRDDSGQPPDIYGSDDWEIWWGLDFDPTRPAPDLTATMVLNSDLDVHSLLPVWSPVVFLFLFWLLLSRWPRLALSTIVSMAFISVVPIVLIIAGIFQGWDGILTFVLTKGDSHVYSIWLMSLFTFIWISLSAVILGNFRARVSGAPRPLGQDLLITINYLLTLTLILLGLYLVGAYLWTPLTRLSPLLGYARFYLLSAVALLIVHPIIVRVTYGAHRWNDHDATAMAQFLSYKLGIEPPALYLVPAAKLQLANAWSYGCSGSGGCRRFMTRITVTEALWTSLPPEERRWVMAHELAHIKLRHWAFRYWGILLPVWIAVFLLQVDISFGPIFAVIGYYAFVKPRFNPLEEAADALALEITGDTAAAVNSLFKLYHLNLPYMNKGGRALLGSRMLNLALQGSPSPSPEPVATGPGVELIPPPCRHYPALVDIYRECRETLPAGTREPIDILMVMEDIRRSQEAGRSFCGIYLPEGQAPVGVVDYVPFGFDGDPAVGGIHVIMVRPEGRRKGVAAEAVSALEQMLFASQEIDAICVKVRVNSTGAFSFWEGLGYQRHQGTQPLSDEAAGYLYYQKRREIPCRP